MSPGASDGLHINKGRVFQSVSLMLVDSVVMGGGTKKRERVEERGMLNTISPLYVSLVYELFPVWLLGLDNRLVKSIKLLNQ